MVVLSPLERGDLPALLALQHAQSGGNVRWSADHLERGLYHGARGGGRQVVVARRGGAVVGGAGWVEAGDRMFGSPVLAADAEAAAALIDRLIERLRETGAASLRISATPADRPKAEALAARGFVHLFDFITLARPAAPVEPLSTPLVRVELAALPAARLRDLYNETFDGVPNAPPVDEDTIVENLRAHWPEGSGAWLDGDDAAGFVWATREHDAGVEHAVVDSVGVRPPRRGRRLGALMVGHLVDAAARAGLGEVHALIASSNEASLALHRGLGFSERARLGVWELSVDPRSW